MSAPLRFGLGLLMAASGGSSLLPEWGLLTWLVPGLSGPSGFLLAGAFLGLAVLVAGSGIAKFLSDLLASTRVDDPLPSRFRRFHASSNPAFSEQAAWNSVELLADPSPLGFPTVSERDYAWVNDLELIEEAA